ncbi:MAG TPA: tRNA 4-thiouridine(8) synthase ThiI [Porticoccaceae bacterium]|nr:tRNA 4-thiouridine(8) synthase ThiI [Porticoccaceae bacterium]
MQFVIKLFPEIIIKSAPVRKRFIRQLRENLKRLLAEANCDADVRSEWDKIEVDIDDCGREDAEDIFSHTPGIANYSRVTRHSLGDFDAIAALVWAEHGQALTNRSFCVRVKRSGKHAFNSVEVERQVGGRLLQQADNARVQLDDPDICIRLEIKDDQLYLIEQTRPGIGGFPLGTQEAVMSLISGGFDSTVASYLTMKRGLRTHFCFFNLGGRSHELGVKEVAWYLWHKFGASHRVKFITVPFEAVVAEILEKVDNAYMGVVLKRMMLRAAQDIARTWHVQTLVTGESVAQVSSQTLPNLAVIDAVSELLTLRPLATMDKNDIIDIARAIGTDAFAAHMPEYCGVISVKPTTRARPERVAAQESHFDFGVLEAAVAARREENIDEIMSNLPAETEIESFAAPQPGMTILDIRHPDEIERKPLLAGSTEVIPTPFYALQKNYRQLDQSKHYLLYCEKGVMSRLHAELLDEQGFKNIGLYSPAH